MVHDYMNKLTTTITNKYVLAATTITTIYLIILLLQKEDCGLHVKYVEEKHEIKYILHYNNFWGTEICLGDKFKHCPVNTCLSTENHTMMPIEDFDAIIFNDPTSKGIRLPEKRNAFQKYIFLSLESPVSFEIRHSDNFYNWTISYRRDSDFMHPFGHVESYQRNIDLNPEDFKRKTKLVAWVASNCNNTKGAKYRMDYVKQLQTYIPIDIYGKCGNLTCPGRMSRDCYKLLDSKYKFYLAFENSFCKDYITEKFFNILNHTNLVPVVMGFGGYKDVAPPFSYVNVDDFQSPEHLAMHLRKLANDIDAYMEYLKWKKMFYVSLEFNGCCELCKRLHEPIEYKWYVSVRKWIWGENGTLCRL